jgi:hypothetical protein
VQSALESVEYEQSSEFLMKELQAAARDESKAARPPSTARLRSRQNSSGPESDQE